MRWLEVQCLEVPVVLPRAVHGMRDALLLDVTGLVIDVGNGRQQASEIERSSAELSIVRAVLPDVLEMEAPVAVAVALEMS